MELGTGMNSFDGYVYLNLDERTDRRSHVESLMSSMGVATGKLNRLGGLKHPQNGHLGCVRNHIKALQMAKDQGWDRVLVMEDDFAFRSDVTKEYMDGIMNKALARLGNDWDVLMLGYANQNIGEEVEAGVLSKLVTATGPSCYVVQKHYLDSLIGDLSTAERALVADTRQFDHVYCTPFAFDQMWMGLQRRSKWFAITPSIGAQDANLGSSIMVPTWPDHSSCKDWPSRTLPPGFQ